MPITSVIEQDTIEIIAAYLDSIDDIKKERGESKNIHIFHLKSLYKEGDISDFFPSNPFKVLKGFIKKNSSLIELIVDDATVISEEELPMYCNFVAEETKKAIRARIEELDKKIELEENTISNRSIATFSSKGTLDPESFKKRSATEIYPDRISSKKKGAVTFSGIDEGNVAERKDFDSRPRGGSLGGSSK